MELTEDEIIRKYAKHCGYCNRNTLPPYEYEVTCISCGFKLIRTKHEIAKRQRKKIHLINRLKYAENKIFCICVEVYKYYEGGDSDKTCEVSSTLKNKKTKNNQYLNRKT